MRSPLDFGRALLPRSVSRRLQLERDILEEIQFHIDCRTQANQECGMAPEEARSAALEQFGDLEAILDECVDAHESHPARRAARFAARVLPVGLACGFATAVLIVLYAIAVRLPATYPPEGNWAVVWWKHESTGFLRSDSSLDDFEAWKKGGTAAEYVGLGAYQPVVSRLGGETERLMGKYVADDYLREHGVRPVVGRTFRSDIPDRVDRPVMISYQLWQDGFGGRRDVVGQVLDVDGVEHHIVGVTPESYQTYFPFDFFAPIDFAKGDRTTRRYLVSTRLKPGVTLERAQHQFGMLDPVGGQNSGWHVFLRRPQEVYGGQFPRRLIPYGALGLMLLVVAVARARSMRRFHTKSELLTTLAGMAFVGLATTAAAVELLCNTVVSGADQRFNFGLDTPLVLGSILMIVLGSLSSGTARREKSVSLSDPPARSVKRVSISLLLTSALAFLILVSAVTLTNDWLERRSPDVGFDVENVFTVQLLLPAADFAERDVRRAFFEETIARLDKNEAIEEYSFTNGFPTLTDAQATSVLVPDPDAPGQEIWARTGARAVGIDYFETVGIKTLAGRPFERSESEERVAAAVVNAGMAARFWPDGSAIGHRISVYGVDVPFEITAIVADAVSSTPGDERSPMLYPLVWHWTAPRTIVVRTSRDFAQVASSIRETITSVNPAASVGEMIPGNAGLLEAARNRAVTAGLVWLFAFVALAAASSFTLRFVREATGETVRALSLQRPARVVHRTTIRPLIAGIGLSLVVGATLSTPFARLLVREMSLDTQVGVFCVLLPALLLITFHATAAYIPLRQAGRLWNASRP